MRSSLAHFLLEWPTSALPRDPRSGPGLRIWSSLARSGPIGDDRARLVSGPGQACRGPGQACRDRARLVATGPGLFGKVQIAAKGGVPLEWANLDRTRKVYACYMPSRKAAQHLAEAFWLELRPVL